MCYLDVVYHKPLEESPESEAAVEFTEFLLHYLIRTLLPYENIPLESGLSQLTESTWYTISSSIMLIALLLRESTEQIQAEIVQSVVALRSVCKAIQLGIDISLTIQDKGEICFNIFMVIRLLSASFFCSGLPKSVMLPAMRDLLQISVTWTDQSRVLAQEMSRSGFIHTMTINLHVGRYMNTFDSVRESQT